MLLAECLKSVSIYTPKFFECCHRVRCRNAAIWSLSGEKRTLRGHGKSVVRDPQAVIKRKSLLLMRDAGLNAQASLINARPPVTITKMTAVVPSTVVMCRQPSPTIVLIEVPSPSAPIASSSPQVEASTNALLIGA